MLREPGSALSEALPERESRSAMHAPSSCQGLALASTSSQINRRREAKKRSIPASSYAKLVDAKPKAWHDGVGLHRRLQPEPDTRGLDPAIQLAARAPARFPWVAASSPAMTIEWFSLTGSRSRRWPEPGHARCAGGRAGHGRCRSR
jgi:hypothetical protein